MAVPRNRMSNARKNSRRSHHAKKAKQMIACANCKEKVLPHTICASCGAYGERIVMSREETEE